VIMTDIVGTPFLPSAFYSWQIVQLALRREDQESCHCQRKFEVLQDQLRVVELPRWLLTPIRIPRMFQFYQLFLPQSAKIICLTI
jgi:hypothetical protein